MLSIIALALFSAAVLLYAHRKAVKGWLIRQSDVYPTRWWWPVTRIYGGPDGQASRICYMTRIIIGYQHRAWRQLYVHIFHREDMDRDPHDHPFGFWTFPLFQGYYEEVWEHDCNSTLERGCFKVVHVPRWRWSYRKATHTHRIVSTDSGRWPLVTLVWREKNARKWGFWCHGEEAYVNRRFTPYQQYVYEGTDSNNEGVDEACPGTAGRYQDARR